MPTIPADIGPNDVVPIPPDQPVSYVSDLLEIDLESSGDAGLNYYGLNDGGQFNWSFMGYDTVTPLDGAVQDTLLGPDVLGFIVQPPGASFELSSSTAPDVLPAQLLISDAGAQQVLLTQSAEGLGVSVIFDDPAIANATLTWPATFPV